MKPSYLVAGATAVAVLVGAAAFMSARDPQTPSQQGRGRDGTVAITRRDFVRLVRLSGTVEAVQATTVAAPRLSGPYSNSLVVTRLIRPGTRVKPGDLLVEFDRQDQLQNALDRRAELTDLEQQIRKKDAEGRAARATRRQRDPAGAERPEPRRARDGQEPDDREDPGREERAGARGGRGQAGAAQDHLRSEAAGGGSRPEGPRDPAEQGGERHAPGGDQRDAHGDSLARSRGSRCCGRSGRRATWRRFRKARRSGPASRSSTS